jgi:hypothetical protein
MAWKTVCPFCGEATDNHAGNCGRELGARDMHKLVTRVPDPLMPAVTGHAGYVTVETDLADWTRWHEVVEYAGVRGITIAEAVNRLVNSGLSHWRR